MCTEVLLRPALGSTAPLGTLFDSRTDQFLEGIFLTNRKVPDTTREIITATHSELQYTYSDSIAEKCSRLGVTGEIQICIMLGLITLTGSGSYISYPKPSAKSVRRSLIYKIRTKTERLNIFHPDLKSEFSAEALRLSPGSTHFVSQIHWGTDSVLMCEHVNKFEVDETDIGDKLEKLLESAGKAIKGSTNVTLPQGVVGNNLCHQLRLFGDILPNDDVPDSIEAAVNLLKQVPGLINASDSGWGVPVAYSLLPISMLNGYIKNDTDIGPVAQTIDTTTVSKVVNFLETMEVAQQQLFDLYFDVKRFQYSLHSEEVSQVFTYKNQVDAHVTSLKSNLSSIIHGVKMNRLGPENVEDFLVMLNKRELASANITRKILEWSNIKRQVNFAKQLVAKGIKSLQSDWALQEMIEENRSKKFFVFYSWQHSLDTDISYWKQNTKLFFHLYFTSNDKQAFVVVNCNLVECPQMNTTSTVQVIERGVVIVENLLEDQKRLQDLAVLNFLDHPNRIFPRKPSKKLFPYTTHCPGSNCNQGATYNWTCSRCRKTVLIGEDHYLYCDCGQSYLNRTSYKCSNPRHGDMFDQHDATYIQHYLASYHHPENVSMECVTSAKTPEATTIKLSTTAEYTAPIPTTARQPTPISLRTTTQQPTSTQEPTNTTRATTTQQKPTTPRRPKPTDCVDVLKFSGGVAASGIYQIYLENDQNNAVQVYCDQQSDKGGWTVFQRKMDTTDFYKHWSEYSLGFGNLSGSHWLGLNTLVALTKRNDIELRVDLEDWDDQKGLAIYNNFHVASEAEKFRLDVSGYSGNIGDSLANHNGMPFTTIDNDNDNSPANCAEAYHGAWWYNNCHHCNPNGLYPTSALEGPEYDSWWHWKRAYISLKWTEMKIRKRSFKPTN